MTTDAERITLLSRTADRELGQAREALTAALGRVDAAAPELADAFRDANLLSRQSLDVGMADDLARQLTEAETIAGGLDEKLDNVRDILTGRPDQATAADQGRDGATGPAVDDLTRAAGALDRADAALTELQGIQGSDTGAARAMRERSGLFRSAVDESRSGLERVGNRLDSAQLSLQQLPGAQSSAGKDRGRLAGKVMRVGSTATSDLGEAQAALAEVAGRLDTVVQAGMNPTPAGDQRYVASASDRAPARRDGTARGGVREK